MTITLTALEIANEFIRLAEAAGKPISNMKLQKLVYLAQGFHLALKGEPLFNEKIEAWRYGPVIPELYHKFKIYFAGPIPADHPFKSGDNKLGEFSRALIAKVYESYGRFSAAALSDYTHKSGSPWEEVYRAENSSSVINPKIMEPYFKSLVKSN